ncbi:MAG: serine hydrolase domain-containing protein [Acidobacteriaceae bacterium]
MSQHLSQIRLVSLRFLSVFLGAASIGLLPLAGVASAQNTLPAAMQAKVDAIAAQVLQSTDVPSASVGIVQDGHIAYLKAYGHARLAPDVDATPTMRYSIGSISKQFTAAAILLLEQQGKLSLDDTVSRWFPNLTDANQVTLRELLSHTSGYQDYWPEDYVMPPMLLPTTADAIMAKWGEKPLDFPPGTQWQYSNTNFVIAGKIVESVSGEPLMQFLQEHIFTPLQMSSVANSDIAKLGQTDAQGYYRHALGPQREAPKEGAGWMFAAGELAMPAHDLLLWNISQMDRSLLAPRSYDEMFQDVKLKDGKDTHYGLGVFLSTRDQHPIISHSGEVSGFVSDDVVLPQDKIAVAVLTNEDASRAASMIANQVVAALLGLPEDPGEKAEAQARQIFLGLQQGKIDRNLFTDNCNAYFSQQALGDYASSLRPLGQPLVFRETAHELRGGMTFHAYEVLFQGQHLIVTTYVEPDGKLEQYLVIPAK